MHGGKSLRGLASPTTKTGRWSKDLPTRMSARYAEAMADERLLELGHDVALLDARTSDVLARVDSGESGEKWQQLQQAVEEYREAPDQRKAEALAWVFAVIDVGAQDWAAWTDVRKLVQERRQVVESERKRQAELQETMTSKQAAIMLGVITSVIRKHVTDRDTLAAIGTDLGRLVDNGPGKDATGRSDGQLVH